MAEKAFVGCGGQEITDEVRVTIAAQACMLLLNRKTNVLLPIGSDDLLLIGVVILAVVRPF